MFGVVSCAAWACTGDGVDIDGHVVPVRIATSCVVYAPLTWMASNLWIMRYHGFVFSEQWENDNLESSIDD